MDGVYPSTRHNGKAFDSASDAVRATCAGDTLGWKAILLFVKGDWSEFALTLGLPTWASKAHPMHALQGHCEQLDGPHWLEPDVHALPAK